MDLELRRFFFIGLIEHFGEFEHAPSNLMISICGTTKEKKNKLEITNIPTTWA